MQASRLKHYSRVPVLVVLIEAPLSQIQVVTLHAVTTRVSQFVRSLPMRMPF